MWKKLVEAMAALAGAAASFICGLPPILWVLAAVMSLDYATGDKSEILSFDSYVMYMCTYTQDANLLRNGISNMTAYGDTALYDALAAAINNAANQAGARCVIGFTDGEDNASSRTADEVIYLAQRMEVPVYLIGTYGADQYELQRICELTGGYYTLSVFLRQLLFIQLAVVSPVFKVLFAFSMACWRSVRAMLRTNSFWNSHKSSLSTIFICNVQVSSFREFVNSPVDDIPSCTNHGVFEKVGCF